MRIPALVVALLASSPALATDLSVPHTGDRSRLLDIHVGGHPYGATASVGARYGIPIVDNGFIEPLNNSVYINFGADLYTTYSNSLDRRGLGLGIPVTMQWNFYFTDEWSAFGEAGINIYAGPGVFDGGDDLLFNGSWVITAAGGRYHLSDSLAIQARVGWPYASIGIEFPM